jgi:hypothetical protein
MRGCGDGRSRFLLLLAFLVDLQRAEHEKVTRRAVGCGTSPVRPCFESTSLYTLAGGSGYAEIDYIKLVKN